MNHYRHRLKSTLASSFRCILKIVQLTIFAIMFISTSCWSNGSADKPINAEEAFLQGQQYVEQSDLALAALSLTHIPPSSPYAKLLAGNIAVKNAEYDQAFLLLLPLQSMLNFNQTALASLHASLSTAYEKQDDVANALEQLVRRQYYLEDTDAISHNQQHIWQLLSAQTTLTLVAMRGESADTTIQGWIDLSLATRNQDSISSLATWNNSYPDHVATNLAKMLSTQAQSENNLPANFQGNIALLLPLQNESLAEKIAAFKLGLQTALSKNNMLNEIKVFSQPNEVAELRAQNTLGNAESFTYVIAPNLSELSSDSNSTLIAEGKNNNNLSNPDLSILDEARKIAEFAVDHTMQKIVVVTTTNDSSSKMLSNFAQVWETERGYKLKLITLSNSSKDGISLDINQLMNLRSQTSTQDMILLAMSASEAHNVRPYLDISMPTMAFSSLNTLESDSDGNQALNAIYFTDIPFLLMPNNPQFSYYKDASSSLKSNELKRYFALGVDYITLLSAHRTNNEAIINGLTGKLLLNSNGQIKRQLSIGKFTYQGVVLDR